MASLSHLLNALLATLLVAGVGHWAIRWFAPRSPARFGAFMLAIGYTVARYGAPAPPWMADALPQRGAGTMAALALLWYWWFARRIAHDR